MIDRVLARELELGVVGAERPHRSLEYEPFAADEIVLAVPAGHAFAGRDDVTIDELRTVPMVVQQEGSGVRALTERELRHHGVRLRDLDVVAELGLQESAVTAVAEGLGVTFTSHDSIRNEIALGYVEEASGQGPRAAPRLRARAPRVARAVAARRGVPRVLPRGARPRPRVGPRLEE